MTSITQHTRKIAWMAPIGVLLAIVFNPFFILHAQNQGQWTARGSRSFTQTSDYATYPNQFVSIASGYYHVSGITPDGELLSWGLNNTRQTDIPDSVGKVKAVFCGEYHTIAIKEDGTLATWGDSSIPPPSGITNVKMIATKWIDYNLVLKNDGTLTAWSGNNIISLPVNPSNVKEIAVGRDFSLALKEDGTITAWGNNDHGQINVAAYTNIQMIAAGEDHTVILKADSTVEVIGGNRGYIN